MMARNFTVSAALTLGLLIVGVNVSAMDIGAPTVKVAEQTSLDHQRAASARAAKRADMRASLDLGRSQTVASATEGTQVVRASPRFHERLP